MHRNVFWAGLAVLAVLTVPARRARADGDSPCAMGVTRATVAGCALRASLALEREREGVAVLDARKAGASRLLPTNPVVTFSAGRPTGASAAGESSVAWDASLSQELEIGGQPGKRRAAAEADALAQTHRVEQTRREVLAAAWVAYFEAVAGAEEAELSHRLRRAGEAVATVARANAESGLIAPIDADVADVSLVRLEQGERAAERRFAVARLRLASLLGVPAPPRSWQVSGELAPFPVPVSAVQGGGAVDELPAVRAAESERRAHLLRADAFRRERIPNPTLSVFTQNYERSIGVGLSVPIPLPDPVGHGYAAEVAESEALARQAAIGADELRREGGLALATAREVYQSSKEELEAFTPERVKRAEDDLRNVADEVRAGRLAVRDAVVAEQSLIEFLKARVDARRAVCTASVELANAAGASMRGGL